jgi:hypothetical protein
MRSESRRAQTWRNRALLVFACVFAGLWAALAPQNAFEAGERFRLGLKAAATVCIAVGIVCAIGPAPAVTREGRGLTFAIFSSNLARGFAGLLAAVPLLALPFGIGIMSVEEVAVASVLVVTFLSVAALASAVKLPFLVLPFAAAVWLPNWSAPWTRLLLEFLFLLLFAMHLFAKCRICAMAANIDIRNVASELVTASSVEEICARLGRGVQRRARWITFGLSAANGAALILLEFAPLPISVAERHVLQILLVAGVVLLFLDTRALIWKGIALGLAETPIQPSLLALLGIPWAVGWMIYALHTGNMGDNEAAGVFVLWVVSSLAVNSVVGSGAKSKLQTSLREMVSEAL